MTTIPLRCVLGWHRWNYYEFVRETTGRTYRTCGLCDERELMR